MTTMPLDQLELLAAGMVAHHLGNEWRLTWGDSRRRAGLCRYSIRTITLSRVVLPRMSEREALNLILHEIAHALAWLSDGRVHRHDEVWREVHRSIGGNGQRLYQIAELEDREGLYAYTGTCPDGHTITYHRRPGQVIACTKGGRTFHLAYAFEWRSNVSGNEALVNGRTAAQHRHEGMVGHRAPTQLMGVSSIDRRLKHWTCPALLRPAERDLARGDLVDVLDPTGLMTGTGRLARVERERYVVRGLPNLTGKFGEVSVLPELVTSHWPGEPPVVATLEGTRYRRVKLEVGDPACLCEQTEVAGFHAGLGKVVSVESGYYLVSGLPYSDGGLVEVPFSLPGPV